MENIETRRLILRSFKLDNWQALFEYLSDPKTYEYEPGNPIDEAEAKAISNQRSKSDDFIAVALKDTGTLIGQLSFKQTEPLELKCWELGYIFRAKYQGKGFATEAAVAIVKYGFQKLPVHRIVANCNPENMASWRVLERAGFRREGYLRKNIFFRKTPEGEPKWTDTLEYAMLESDALGLESVHITSR